MRRLVALLVALAGATAGQPAAHAAPGYIAGQVLVHAHVTCAPGPTCSVTSPAASPVFNNCSESRDFGPASGGCSGHITATHAPSALSAALNSSQCGWWSGSGVVQVVSPLAGGTFNVPVTTRAHASATSSAEFRGQLVTSTRAIYVEGFWSNACFHNYPSTYSAGYRIVTL